MGEGYVLSFTNGSFKDFFDGFDIDIGNSVYSQNGESKANRLRTFWEIGDNETVGKVLIEMSGLIRNAELAGHIHQLGFSENVEKIGRKLLEMPNRSLSPQSTSATLDNNLIHIEIRPEIYAHIKRYLDTGDYFHAVEEAYKIVREKLISLTTKERASDVFNLNAESNKYHIQLFGHTAETGSPESDFFRGIGYIHLAVQFLRNEKFHRLASDLDKNLTIHYLSLASLAYDLISREGE
ncbi:MAG: TIGR02391 family protein [Rickettsiales bacterium]|jgi:uncharacterized protein (TIGR02391 family)|nr:TIGR02391 family protein [Rickettsiales bacterium]